MVLVLCTLTISFSGAAVVSRTIYVACMLSTFASRPICTTTTCNVLQSVKLRRLNSSNQVWCILTITKRLSICKEKCTPSKCGSSKVIRTTSKVLYTLTDNTWYISCTMYKWLSTGKGRLCNLLPLWEKGVWLSHISNLYTYLLFVYERCKCNRKLIHWALNRCHIWGCALLNSDDRSWTTIS